jgi:adenylate kinase
MMNLVILGAPGSGKGTQAHRLAEAYSLRRISTGDILRDAVARGTELGMKAKAHMDSGGLVPDGLVIDLIAEALDGDGGHRGFIFDGFPRTVKQAEALDDLLVRTGRKLDAVVLLEVSEEEVVRRLTLRRSCPGCERLYNMESDPPGDGVHCDVCGEELIIRSDDREDVIRKRLEVYRRQTEPIIRWYGEKGTVLRIDGEQGPDEVLAQVRRLIDP